MLLAQLAHHVVEGQNELARFIPSLGQHAGIPFPFGNAFNDLAQLEHGFGGAGGNGVGNNGR